MDVRTPMSEKKTAAERRLQRKSIVRSADSVAAALEEQSLVAEADSAQSGEQQLLHSPALLHRPASAASGGLLPAHIEGPWLLDYDDLTLTKLVDSDKYAEIYHGKYREHEVAIKKLCLETWGESLLEEVARQARIRCRLNHPNINPFLGYTEFPSIALVSSWAPNGSLQALLHNREKNNAPLLPCGFSQRIVRDVAAGLQYLHAMKPQLIHRALSTRKVLINGQLRAVITDFMMAASLEEPDGPFSRHKRLVAPPKAYMPPAPWAAPELLAHKQYGLSCDIYSWGVVVQELLRHTAAPAPGAPQVVDPELLTQCLAVDPAQRPDAEELLARCPVHYEFVLPEGLGLQEAEEIPGESTMEGWRVAPKFKLAYEELEFEDQVAEGGFSEIYKGTYKNRPVAIKKLKTWLLGEETLNEFQREAEVLASLFHPNILVMVGITTFPSLCIVTPWAERGSLDRVLYGQEPLSCRLRCLIQLGIARGILYLHSVRILHRDIKAANVLLGRNYNPRVADFGLSVRKAERGDKNSSMDNMRASKKTLPIHEVAAAHGTPMTPAKMRSSPFLPVVSSEPSARPNKAVSRMALLSPTAVSSTSSLLDTSIDGVPSSVGTSHPLGTWPWQAPEVMRCQPHNEQCDVYALGMTMWEIWARKPPFKCLPDDEADRMARDHVVWRPPLSFAKESAPAEIILLIARCWHVNPLDRPTMAEVVQTLAAVLRAVEEKENGNGAGSNGHGKHHPK